MDIDSPPLPPDTHSNSMDVDDVSFEALSAKKPAPDSCIRPPALSNCLREEDHSFVGFFAESPAPFASGTQNKLSSPPKTSVTSGRKRNLEPDSSLELSSEDASPSSPLASLAGPVRPSLQKAASAAALFSGQTAVSRRRASDRSIGSRSSTSSVLKPTSSGQSSRRSSNESSPPKKERLQAQKKARADSVDTMASRPRALVNSQRPASGSDVSDKYRPSSAGYSNKSFQQSIGLGLPPPARSSYQSENLSSRPRHIVSASESHMTFANTKRRPASDSHRSIKSSMPPDTRMESDGKRLPCHQVSEDGIMRVKPEVVRLNMHTLRRKLTRAGLLGV